MKTLTYILEKYSITWQDIFHRSPEPVCIPDVGRNNLAILFRELGYQTGVEIGVWKGYYSKVLCTSNPSLTLYGVDPWEATAFPDDITGWTKKQEEFDEFYEAAKRRLRRYNCKLIRKYSMDAVKDFKDNSIDFVYIDGNHDFQNTTNDIVEWTKKVRPGGIISGHDYASFRKSMYVHTKYVVRAYTTALGIKPWFVLGADEKVPNVIRDTYRSWFWVKDEN